MKELVNKSELRMIVKEYEEYDIRRSATKEELISILDGEYSEEYRCPLVPIKKDMETYIQTNMTKMRTQLPDCTGKCTTFGCPDGIVINCHTKIKPLMEKTNGNTKNT